MAPHAYAPAMLREAFRIWREEPWRFLLFGAFVTGLNLLCGLANIPGILIATALQGPLTAGLVLATLAIREGRRPGTADFLGGQTMMRPLLWLALVTGLISLAGFVLLVIPGLVISTLWFCAVPVMLLQGGTLKEVLKTSQTLIAPVFLAVFSLELLLAATEALVSLPLAYRMMDQQAMNLETALPVMLAQCLLVPFSGILATLVYLERTGEFTLPDPPQA
jgi:hypothetical protein